MNKKLKVAFYFFIFAAFFFFDRLVKYLVIQKLFLDGIKLFNFLNLNLVLNRGVSFGLFGSKINFWFMSLAILIFLIILALLVYTINRFKNNKNIFFEVMVLAGAMSNLLDRFIYNGVIDFIDFHISTYHWPTFNFADIFVFIGITGMFLMNLNRDN
ncbi:MAG: signal peptidase II [bacterium]